MSLSDLASLGSFVSGVAVLVSLVFLFFQVRQMNHQVRQAERNQQAAIRQGRTASGVEIALAHADETISAAVIACEQGGPSLSDAQVLQHLVLSRAMFSNWEDAFYQHREGLLDDTAFASWVRNASFSLRSPSRRVAWTWLRGAFGGEFEGFIDRALAEIRASATPSERLGAVRAERWNHDLAKEAMVAAADR